MPRIRAKRPAVATPNLAELLADFSLTDAPDEGAAPGSIVYLEKLAEALQDGVLTEDEAAVLHDVAAAYGLSAEDRTGAHRALLLALCHLALDDGRVSQAERAELRSMAAVLGQPDAVVTGALDQAEAARNARLSADLQPLPDDWAYGDPLRVGDKVVFTGCNERLRQHLETRAEQLGVRVMNAVSRKTTLLVTDGAFIGTKADAA
jgi:DNA polymerase III subunit epsilon